MPHDVSFMQPEPVHYIANTGKPFDPALCGVRWKEGSDKVKNVTCERCIQLLKEKGILK